jgi:hypothetical protein
VPRRGPRVKAFRQSELEKVSARCEWQKLNGKGDGEGGPGENQNQLSIGSETKRIRL